MSGYRQSGSGSIFVPSDKKSVFKACLEVAEEIGRVKSSNESLGSISLKCTPGFMANPVTLQVSVIPSNGGCEVRFEGSSFDGAVGLGSCQKAINKFCDTLNPKIDSLPQIKNDSFERENNLDQLVKLKQLLDMGVISEKEFETKKKQLL